MKKKEEIRRQQNSLQKAINYSMKIGTFNPIKKGLVSGYMILILVILGYH